LGEAGAGEPAIDSELLARELPPRELAASDRGTQTDLALAATHCPRPTLPEPDLKKVALYSILLLVGLVLSQFLPGMLGGSFKIVGEVIQFLTMTALAYIMVHVGLEFHIDKRNLGQYGWDYVVAATAAAFPWIFCCAYFMFVMVSPEARGQWAVWKESLLASRFSAPTSAGVLFSMLAAAGLAATWLFKKARILAIFDDLDTVLLMIPLKAAMVGWKWQLGAVIAVMAVMLWVAYRWLHAVRLPSSWRAVLTYSFIMVAITEAVYYATKSISPDVPIHIEVLLPAFVLGCIMKTSHHEDPAEPKKIPSGAHGDHTHAAGGGEHLDPHADPAEARATTIVSAAFMVLVGLSMPAITGQSKPVVEEAATIGRALITNTPEMGWGTIVMHVLAVTIIANIGKMFPLLCYRKEAHWRDRLAVCVAMWPRGEVGAGVLVLSLSYGIGGPVVVVAMLSLALNLILTGVFIIMVKKIMLPVPESAAA
jgi:hypothetical protein